MSQTGYFLQNNEKLPQNNDYNYLTIITEYCKSVFDDIKSLFCATMSFFGERFSLFWDGFSLFILVRSHISHHFGKLFWESLSIFYDTSLCGDTNSLFWNRKSLSINLIPIAAIYRIFLIPSLWRKWASIQHSLLWGKIIIDYMKTTVH